MAQLAGRLAELRQARGRLGDLAAIAGAAAAAAIAALLLNASTPVRFVENLTYDLRVAWMAPPAQDEFVIVKMDDAAMNAMRDASPCRCLSPINKVWLADLIAALDAKGVKAIGVDYLLDTWASPQEFQGFVGRTADVRAPVVALMDPGLRPGANAPMAPKVRYADTRSLVRTDYDNIVRRYDPKPGPMRALSAELIAALGGKPPTQTFAIRYRRPYRGAISENLGAPAPSYSAAYVSALPASVFKGRVALIGAVTRSIHADSGLATEDMHTTPLRFRRGHYDGTPGVEAHLSALSQMLAGDRIITPSPLVVALIVLAAALGGAWLGRGTVSWWIAIVIVLAGMVVSAAAAVGLFAAFAFVAPMTAPTLSFAFAFFVMSRLAAAELAGQRAFYSSTLERYLAPQVIDGIVEGRQAVKIGAEAREITVMISDLEDFSTLLASLPLEEFQVVINAYLDGILEILWRHGAMIDKMTGDGVIVLFGAPVAYEDHADRALACAREVDAFAQAYRQRMIETRGVFGQTRIGIASGAALVGNFGGGRRFNYTAYGEVVVIAARLEAANKTFGARILFSEETKRRATRTQGMVAVGELTLRGVSRPVAAYTLA